MAQPGAGGFERRPGWLSSAGARVPADAVIFVLVFAITSSVGLLAIHLRIGHGGLASASEAEAGRQAAAICASTTAPSEREAQTEARPFSAAPANQKQAIRR